MTKRKPFFSIRLFFSAINVITLLAFAPILALADSPPPPKSAFTGGAIAPIVASLISLPNLSQPDVALWHSQESVGESSLLLLALGSGPALARNGVIALQQNTLQADSASSSRWMVVASDKALLGDLKTKTATLHTPLLWDEKNTLRSDFTLQSRYGIGLGDTVLLVIDRAGWLRRVEKITSTIQMETLLKAAEDPTPKLEVGQPAPDFILPDMNGVLRHPADLKGKKHLLLTFFPKCFTGTCAKQLESLRDAKEELQSLDVEVWGVSVDPAEGDKGQRAFAKQLGLWFPLLPDTGRNLSILYGAAHSPNQTSARMSVLIDKQGVVRWIDKQINATTHGADVAAKVRSLSTQRAS